MATIASLVLQLSADDAKLQKDLRKANKTIQSYAKNTKQAFANIAKITAGAGVAFAGLANESIKAADEIAKSARNAGLSTDSYQELAVAFELGGSSAQALVKTTQALSRQVRDLGRGLSTQKDAFAALGLSFQSLVDLSPEDQLLKIIEALQEVESVSERSAIAQQLMGRAGKELGTILQETAGSLELARDRARGLGITIDESLLGSAEEANDSLFLLSTVIKNNFSKAVLGAIPQTAEYDSRIKELGETVKMLTENFIGFGTWIADNSRLVAGFFAVYATVKVAAGIVAIAGAFKVLTAALVAYRAANIGAAIAQALLSPVKATAGLVAAAAVATGAYLLLKTDAETATVANNELADSMQRVANVGKGLPQARDAELNPGLLGALPKAPGASPEAVENPGQKLNDAEIAQLQDQAKLEQDAHDAALLRNATMRKELDLTNLQTAAGLESATALTERASFVATLNSEYSALEESFREDMLMGAELSTAQQDSLRETARLIGLQVTEYDAAAAAASRLEAAQAQSLEVQVSTEKVGAYANMASQASTFFNTIAEGSKAGFLLAQGAALANAYMTYAQGTAAATLAGVNMTMSLAANPLTALSAPAAGAALTATLSAANTASFGISAAIIAAQTVQGLETGGFVNQGGQFLVGERGPEMVNLPRGSAVVDNARTDRMLSGSGGSRIDHVVNNVSVGFGRNSQSTADAIGPRVLASLRQGEIDRSGSSNIPKTRRL